jgi:hypothetical protein
MADGAGRSESETGAAFISGGVVAEPMLPAGEERGGGWSRLQTVIVVAAVLLGGTCVYTLAVLARAGLLGR